MKDKTRREMLKKASQGATIAGAVTVGSSSSVFAEPSSEEQQELVEKYTNRDILEGAFRENAGEALAMLQKEGYVEERELSQLPVFDSEREILDMENIHISTIKGTEEKLGTEPGETTALLRASLSKDDTTINLVVLPEASSSYAVIEESDGVLIANPASDEVSPSDSTYKRCTDNMCDHGGVVCMCTNYTYEKVSCIDNTCAVLETGCDDTCCQGPCKSACC